MLGDKPMVKDKSEKPTIFLSSTWADLKEHREAVLFTLAKLRKWVVAMEYFGAMPGTPLSESLKAVRLADIFVGVIGTRYGSKDKDMVSITQREYEEAYKHNKYILIYLLDEENHPVLPKFVDTGRDAEKLAIFRHVLAERHTPSSFSSPQDLALRVGVDLINQIDLYNDGLTVNRTHEFLTEMPTLLSKAGYNVGMQKHIINLSSILELRDGNKLLIRDPVIEEIIVAGYLAVNMNRSNYDVIRLILTFDAKLWSLFVNMTRYLGLDDKYLAEFINTCREPTQFRLLVKLSGELALSSCVDPICRQFLEGPSLDKRFSELREQATPIRNVVRDALLSMPTSVLPIVEKYLQKSISLERWQQKKVFEVVTFKLKKHLEEEAAK